MTELNNKFPGKDVSQEDLDTKFPLVAKKSETHKSIFSIAGVEFGGIIYQFLQVLIWLNQRSS